MASRNQVTLTLAGDHDDLTKSFDAVDARADQTARSVGESSKRMADEVGNAQKRINDEVKSSAEAYEAAAEATDTLDTRAMGFRDTVTGVQDSVLGFSQVLKGDLSADALVTAGAGVGDLASGFTNLLIPGLKSAKDWLGNAATATRNFLTTSQGAAIAAGGLAAAVGLAFIAYQSFVRESEAASIQSQRLERDLRLLAATGEATGDAQKALNFELDDAAAGIDARSIPVLGRLADQTQKVTTGVEFLDNSLFGLTGVIPGFGAEAGDAAEKLEALEDGLIGLVQQGASSDEVMRIASEAAEQLGVSTDELIARMPELADELSRVETEQRETTDATRDFTDALRAQTDPIFAVIDAQQQQQEAVQGLRDAIREHGEDSEEARIAALDLAEAELGLVGAIGEVAGATDADLLPTLRQMRDDGRLSRRAFEALVEAIGDTRSEAAALDGTRARVDVDIIYNYGSRGEIPSSFGPQRRQHGGPLAPWMWVGEEGPELISGQQVLNHHQSMAMLQQTQQMQSEPVVVQVYMDNRLIVEQVRRGLKRNESFRLDVQRAVA